VDLTSGVLIAWDIAAAEAGAGRAAEISPGHLVIGLSTLCDGDLARRRARRPDPGAEDPSVLAADAAALREAFVRMGVDPIALRRRVPALAAAPRDRMVTAPVAAALLEGRARSGDEVVVEGRDDAIVLRITRPERRSAPRGPLR
jgi:hypothetical protein